MNGNAIKAWRGVVLVACVGLAAVSVSAQTPEKPDVSLAIQRSYAIQNQLAAIDQDKAGFVDQLLQQWAGYLPPGLYDIQQELRPLAMKAPAWQLYGASLAGDFQTFVRVLTGAEGAGQYINAFATPQAKTAYYGTALPPGDPGADLLGADTDSLVFFPIKPCRMVDTRGTGARTGMLGAAVGRAFDLTTSGYAKGQGGVTSGCTGLPGVSPAAWAVNITATFYTANGWLVAYPYGGTEPVASVVNYGPNIYAIASGQTLAGCYNCVDDVNIKAYVAATHVVIDVVGYYAAANASSSGVVTDVAGTLANISANSHGYAYGGLCPAGTRMIGGEIVASGNNIAVGDSASYTATQWRVWAVNNDTFSNSFTVSSKCLDTPVKIF